jgi:hypothetical protein
MEKKQQPSSAVEELAKLLNRTVTNVMPNNVEQNATLWDNYAREWSTEKDFVKKMLADNG